VRGRNPSLWALLTALGTTILLVSPFASGAGPSADELRRRAAGLEDQSRNAVLGLYALESRLTGARAQLGALQARSVELQREREATRARLAIAVHALRLSQRQLAQRLRVLYEQDDLDPIAVVLGATSLDEAMNGIDGLNHLATQNEGVIEQTRRARRQLSAVASSLAARKAELTRLEQSAAATAASLTQARSERLAYIGRLATERQLTAAQITTLETQAKAAEQKAATIAVQAAAPPPTVLPLPTLDPVQPLAGSPGGRTIIVSATGYSLPGRTSTGLQTGWGVVAVDPGLIPLGSKLSVPGYGEGVAADTGDGVRGPTIDLWFPTLVQALAWGRRTVTITLH
jgi:3D (Asp-Asp-Asp) domain-containing protein/peptidoglycan hydrolase CwlO-like protein